MHYRNIADVHKQIINIIPDDNNDLKKELDNYIYSLWNLAPELYYSAETYIPYSNILSKHICFEDKNEPKWKYHVKDIFCGKI